MTSDTFTDWRKATYSHGNGACVEAAADQHIIGVRDAAQDGYGQVLQFRAAAWRASISITKCENA
jgi:Domain of unknown function (DUF397)